MQAYGGGSLMGLAKESGLDGRRLFSISRVKKEERNSGGKRADGGEGHSQKENF